MQSVEVYGFFLLLVMKPMPLLYCGTSGFFYPETFSHLLFISEIHSWFALLRRFLINLNCLLLCNRMGVNTIYLSSLLLLGIRLLTDIRLFTVISLHCDIRFKNMFIFLNTQTSEHL